MWAQHGLFLWVRCGQNLKIPHGSHWALHTNLCGPGVGYTWDWCRKSVGHYVGYVWDRCGANVGFVEDWYGTRAKGNFLSQISSALFEVHALMTQNINFDTNV